MCSNSSRSGGRIFFSSFNFVWWLLFGRLHVNMHTPLTQRSQCGLTMPLSRHSVGIYLENKFTRNLLGNFWRQLSQLAEPLWTDPGIKSGISVHEQISTLKKKVQAWNQWSNILPKSSQVRKCHYMLCPVFKKQESHTLQNVQISRSHISSVQKPRSFTLSSV